MAPVNLVKSHVGIAWSIVMSEVKQGSRQFSCKILKLQSSDSLCYFMQEIPVWAAVKEVLVYIHGSQIM